MTITVNVRTRAWPAKVSINGESHQIEASTNRDFHIAASATISVNEFDPDSAKENPRPFEGEEVPGAKQNDELLKPVGGKASTEVSGKN